MALEVAMPLMVMSDQSAVCGWSGLQLDVDEDNEP